jgi:hypothetical protein
MCSNWRTLMVGGIRRLVCHRLFGRDCYIVIVVVVSVMVSSLFAQAPVSMVEAGRHGGRYVKCIAA